jgi:hypothetical protein
MWWSFRPAAGANSHRRSLKHFSGTNSVRLFAGSGLSSVRVSEADDHHTRLAEHENSALERALVFSLELAVAAAACTGAILAMFAWSWPGL